MPSDLKKLGNEGEVFAAEFLEKQGYRILERNFRCRMGELDLVVLKDEYLVFVEVKTRSRSGISPLISITKAKRSKIRKLAEYYLLGRPLNKYQPRFDVIGLTKVNQGYLPEHIVNAF